MDKSSLYLLALAVLPSVLLGIYIYFKDTLQREPVWLVLLTFIFGALSVIPAMFIEETLVARNPYQDEPMSSLYMAFVVAGCTEEFCKLVFLYLLIWRNKHFDEYFDGIVYAVFISLGFACVENILYVTEGGRTVGIVRALVSVPGHFLFAVVAGYFFALARFSRKFHKRIWYSLMTFICPMILHGVFDAILMISSAIENPTVSGAFVLLFIYFDIKLWKIGKRKIDKLEGR